MRKIINKIAQIPEKIKFQVLNYYIIQCLNLQIVAFFQWRKMNPPPLKKLTLKVMKYRIEQQKELSELIESHLLRIFRHAGYDTKIVKDCIEKLKEYEIPT